MIPFAALLALWLSPRSSTPGGRAFAVASLAISVFLTVEVALFASQASVDRIEERNLFYLAPFGLIAMLALGADGLITRRRSVLIVAAVVAGGLPFFIPFTRTITTSAVSDTFAMLPWWWVQDHLVSLGDVKWAALAACLGAAALFVFLPRRFALVLPVIVGGYFLLTAYVVEYGIRRIEKTSAWIVLGGNARGPIPDWIDRTRRPPTRKVAVLWTDIDADHRNPVWESKFFNRGVEARSMTSTPSHTPDPLPEVVANRSTCGRPRHRHGPARPGTCLRAAPPTSPAPRSPTTPLGVNLYRVNGPVVILTPTGGLYHGRHLVRQDRELPAGRVHRRLARRHPPGRRRSCCSERPQTVIATERGRIVGRATIPVSKETTLEVPLTPSDGITAAPCSSHMGKDARPGASVQPDVLPTTKGRWEPHFLEWNYKPPR